MKEHLKSTFILVQSAVFEAVEGKSDCQKCYEALSLLKEL